MNIELLKSKTVLASVALLVLSVVRVAMGDATALQGVQEGIMALIPIFLRAAIGKGAGVAADAAAQGAEQGAKQGFKAGAAKAAAVATTQAGAVEPLRPAAGEQ